MSIVGWLLFGGLSGWIASKIMGTDAQQGVVLNIVVGIVGAVLGGVLWGMLVHDAEPYRFLDLGSWTTAVLGASLLLLLVGVIGGPKSRSA
jgi:uncharacterized membrane protein YeaQ/YmgE (transglycosylase-associated protein family)